MEEELNIIKIASEPYQKCLCLSDIETERINNEVLEDVISNQIHSKTRIINITNSFYCNYARKLIENDNYAFIIDYLASKDARGKKIFASLNSLFSFLDIEISFNMGVYLLKSYEPLSEYYAKIDPKKIKDEDSSEFFLYDIYCDLNNISMNIDCETNSDYYSSDNIRMYLNEIGKYKVLTKEEEAELFKKYNEEKDEKAKIKIAEHNLKLAFSIASRFSRVYPDLELEDLVQFGNLGLLKAIEYFDYSKGFKFSTYATWWIGQFIRRGISESCTAIRVPVHARESISKIKIFIAKYVSEHDKEPSVEEISQAVSLPVTSVNNYLNIIRNLTNLTSLESPVGEDEDSTLADFIQNDEVPIESQIETNLLNERVQMLLDSLDERSSFVLKKRFGFYGRIYTLEEIGEELGITRERVRQIQNKALAKLKRPYRKAIISKDESEFNIKILDKKNVPKCIELLCMAKDTSKYSYVMHNLPAKGEEILKKKYGEELRSNNYLDYKNEKYLNELVLPKIELLLKRFDYNAFKYDGIFEEKAKERGIVNYYNIPDSFKKILIELYGADLQKPIINSSNYNLERSLYRYIIPELVKPVEPTPEYNNFKKIFTGKFKTIPNSYATLLMQAFPDTYLNFIVDNKDYDLDVVYGINYILQNVLNNREYAYIKKHLDNHKFDFSAVKADDNYFIQGIYNRIKKSPHMNQISEELVHCMNEYHKNKDTFNLYSFFKTEEVKQLPFALSLLSFDKLTIIRTIFPIDYSSMVNINDYDPKLIRAFYNIIRELKITVNNTVSYNHRPIFEDNIYDLYRFCQYKFDNSNFSHAVAGLTEEEKQILLYCLTYNGNLRDAIMFSSNRLKCDYSECYVVLKDALIKMAQYIGDIDFKLNEGEQKYFDAIIRKLKK